MPCELPNYHFFGDILNLLFHYTCQIQLGQKHITSGTALWAPIINLEKTESKEHDVNTQQISI